MTGAEVPCFFLLGAMGLTEAWNRAHEHQGTRILEGEVAAKGRVRVCLTGNCQTAEMYIRVHYRPAVAVARGKTNFQDKGSKG
jgi:hypothetical protein